MTGAQLAKARAACGLSQSQLSKRLDISIRSISGYETGAWPVPKVVELAVLWLKHEHFSAAPENHSAAPKKSGAKS